MCQIKMAWNEIISFHICINKCFASSHPGENNNPAGIPGNKFSIPGNYQISTKYSFLLFSGGKWSKLFPGKISKSTRSFGRDVAIELSRKSAGVVSKSQRRTSGVTTTWVPYRPSLHLINGRWPGGVLER